MRKFSLLSFLFLALSVFGLPALASTPDGETPAEESICSEETGALKGLCNAYCEAMDCNLNEGVHASAKACGKVLDNYRRKSGDIDPPCLRNTCAQLATVEANAQYTVCLQQTANCLQNDCEGLARRVYREFEGRCTTDCAAEAIPAYEACTQQASADRKSCLDAAGNDSTAVNACQIQYQDDTTTCETELQEAITACVGDPIVYVPYDDSGICEN